MRATLACSLLLLGLTVTGEASRGRPMTLAAMTRVADTIVVARITDVRVAAHPRYRRLPITTVSLRVSETWKGPQRTTFSFQHFGDASTDGASPASGSVPLRAFRREDLPTYAVGEEVVLFLRRPGRSGLTSPVGGYLGKRIVRRDRRSGEATVAPVGGVLIGRDGTAPGAALQSLSLKAMRARAAAALRNAGDER